MESWLRRFSVYTIASVIIVIGVFLIVILNPPKTICDAQVEKFKEAQKTFLFKKEAGKTKSVRAVELCKHTSAPGGCYELFMKVRELFDDLDAVDEKCLENVVGIPEVKNLLWEMVHIFVKLAWIENRENRFLKRTGWFDAADLNLFCRLKRRLQLYYGSPSWEAQRENYLQEFSQSEKISRKEAWNRSLFAIDCMRYL
ncbi:MAG: hypothetical protein D6797_09445 [Bdellovibrio sp.]|nr:MAG: hypothetical protein D6797_09445 [Bdellovibrio sp.]